VREANSVLRAPRDRCTRTRERRAGGSRFESRACYAGERFRRQWNRRPRDSTSADRASGDTSGALRIPLSAIGPSRPGSFVATGRVSHCRCATTFPSLGPFAILAVLVPENVRKFDSLFIIILSFVRKGRRGGIFLLLRKGYLKISSFSLSIDH